MNLAEKSVVVTGGAGFIGSHVVDQLVAQGARVTVVDDFSTGHEENLAESIDSVEVVEGDVLNGALMQDVVDGADVVIHMAVACLRLCLSQPELVHAVNATGTLTVWQAAQRAGVSRAIYVSSSEAFGSAVTVPMSESHELVPTTVYGASKAAGELYAMAHLRTYGLATTVVRPFNNYGPREHASGMSAEVIPKFVHRVLAGRPPVIFGTGEQTRDFTWVEDCARGILAAAASDELVGRSVNIARGSEVSIATIARLVLDRLGSDLDIELSAARPGDVDRHYADVSLAEEVLGFRADVGIEEGIDRYVTWLLEQQPDIDAWAEEEGVRNW